MSRNYDSKVPNQMASIDQERLSTLRGLLREAGESGASGLDANTVYNMSPADLRRAANNHIDKSEVLDAGKLIAGVDPDKMEQDTVDMSPVETWEHVQDAALKSQLAFLTGREDIPDTSLENMLLWAEAEGYAIQREVIQDSFPDTDLSNMHDKEVKEFLADEGVKQSIGKGDSPLDSDTLLGHMKADLIGDLTTNYGYDREELEKMNLGELMQERETASFSDDQKDEMMPGNRGVGEAEPEKTPGQHQDERLKDKLENNHRTAADNGTTGNTSSVQGNDPAQGSSGSGQSDPASGLGGSNADTQDLFPSTGAAVGATTGATTGSATAGAGANAPGQTGDVPTGQAPPSVDGTDKASVTPGDVFTVKDGDGKYSVVFTDLDEIDDAGASNADADADGSSGDDGQGSESGDDTGADAEPPPDTDDGKDLEYTPSGEGGTMPGTRGHDRYEELTGDYVAIKDAVRGSSTINPEREGSDDAVGDSSSGKSLTGSDGDSRYDSVASESAGGSQAGQGFGNSQGAGAITYGPDSDVDFGVGLEDDVPMSVGPQEDLSHLAETTFGSSESESTNSSSLPDGVSPADLKVSDGTPSAVADAMPVGRAQPVEQVTYWAVPEQQQTTSNGDSSQSLDVFETKDTSNSGDSGDRSVAAEKSGLRQEVQVEVEPERSDAKASLKDNAVTEDVSTATTQKSIDFAGKETQATDNSVPAPEKTELVFDSRVDTEVVSHVPVNKLQQEPSGNLEPEPAEVVLPSAEQVEPVNVPSIEISHADPIGVDLTNVQEAEWDESGSDDGDDGL